MSDASADTVASECTGYSTDTCDVVRTHKYQVLSFYLFVRLDGLSLIRDRLLKFCNDNDIKGTILIAHEGINCSISSYVSNIGLFINFIEELLSYGGKIDYKYSTTSDHAFDKMKVKIKKEIIALDYDKFDLSHSGTCVEPEEFDDFVMYSGCVIVDIRNMYETYLGKFVGSIDPCTSSFRDFKRWIQENLLRYQDKKVMTVCTGGIRCEKATAYMKDCGFGDVYYLGGGILKYLEITANKNELWQGSCFVFDNRLSLDDHLHPKSMSCPKCNRILTTDDVKYSWGFGRKLCPNC